MSKASFTTLSTDLNVIQKLDDLPNAVGGLTADQLKAKFDEAANAVKTYINSTLLTQLASESSGTAGANRIGISGIVGLTGTNNVQDALAAIYAAALSAQAGTILDGSISTAKLADSAVTTAKINDGAVTAAKIAADSITGAKCDFSAGLTVDGELAVNDVVVLTSDMYVDSIADLPASPKTGQLCFVKVS